MRAFRFVYSDKITSHEALLRRVGSMSILENRRTQDMLLTVNNIIQGRAPSSFGNLLTEKRTVYNLHGSLNLSVPKVNNTRKGLALCIILQQSTGIPYLVIFVLWQAQRTF